MALIYYSFSGNTHNAILFLQQSLKEKGHICLIRIKPSKEETSFIKQIRGAFFKKETELAECDYNLDKYDFIVFATPVWAFTITPALRSYLSRAEGLNNKRTGFILTYGSGIGVNKARKELEQILKDKEAKVEFELSLKGNKTKDEEYLDKEFSSLAMSYEL